MSRFNSAGANDAAARTSVILRQGPPGLRPTAFRFYMSDDRFHFSPQRQWLPKVERDSVAPQRDLKEYKLRPLAHFCPRLSV